MMSLGIGNFINLAKLKNGYKDVYESWNGRRYKYGVNFNLGIGYPF